MSRTETTLIYNAAIWALGGVEAQTGDWRFFGAQVSLLLALIAHLFRRSAA